MIPVPGATVDPINKHFNVVSTTYSMMHFFKILCCFFVFLMADKKIAAQYKSQPDNIKRQIIGLTPPRQHRVISGLAFGWNAHPWVNDQDTLYIRVHGLNIELGPTGIIGGIWGTMYGFIGTRDSLKHKQGFFSKYGYEDSSILRYPRYGTKIKGLSISIGGLTETYN